jgi:diacylglycerol kinase family enzyme
MVQRCLDALAGRKVTVAIVPAGTANLLAGNLGIPTDLGEAVRIGFHGRRRPIDLGRLNGEHFAVMAGAGFDGDLIKDADRGLKDGLGKLAYVWTGLRHVNGKAPRVRIRVDGDRWFSGRASCVLLGNVGTITGGIHAFDDARPDDGWLDVGVSTAQGAAEWARTLGRMAAGRSDRSPFVRITRARRVDVKLDAPMTYELDGGARTETTRMKVRVVPAAVRVCTPETVG